MKKISCITFVLIPMLALAQHVEIKRDTLVTPRIGIGTEKPGKELHLVGSAILGELSPTDNVVVGSDVAQDAKLTVVNSTFSNGIYIDAPSTPGGHGLRVRGTARIENDAQFDGNLHVSGNLSKAVGSFRIDHPLDPENKYLYHSFVESPDMMNIYNGNVTTDKKGLAIVTLPAYFEALNMDFRYQLTVVGKFSKAIILQKIEGNQFIIKTGKPNTEVSWQVTGIRNDEYARQHRIQTEVNKAITNY